MKRAANMSCERRSEEKLRGTNHILFGGAFENYVTLPVVPAKDA